MVTLQEGVGSLNLRIKLPSGYHLTKGANSGFHVSAAKPGAVSFHPNTAMFSNDTSPEAVVTFRRSASTPAQLRAKVYYCLDGGACLLKDVIFELNFQEALTGEGSTDLLYEISA